MKKPLVYTPGEPAGIGIDCILQLAQQSLPTPLVILVDKQLLLNRAKKLNLSIHVHDYDPKLAIEILPAQQIWVKHIACINPHVCGNPDLRNVPYLLDTLKIAVDGCLAKEFSALVTGPIQKNIINDAGIKFSGHTEFLAELSHQKQTIMLFVFQNMRVALATTHLPLAQVPKHITQETLENTLKLLHAELKAKFKISHPKVFVAGLNPHAGEHGYLGDEEIRIINPVIKKLQKQKLNIHGAYSADILFTPQYLQSCDAILAMYHDQALPAVKAKSFGNAVNVTLGLPFIRTSVDHGTALDIAGSGKADSGSLLEAIKVAIRLIDI